jgi:hypothetical protein
VKNENEGVGGDREFNLPFLQASALRPAPEPMIDGWSPNIANPLPEQAVA